MRRLIVHPPQLRLRPLFLLKSCKALIEGSAGRGCTWRLITSLVPYRGSPPAMQDLLAGQIDLWFGTPDNLPLVRSGSIKAYAIAGEKRMTIAPDIPTFAEFGLPGVSLYGWLGLFAPKATPKDVIAKLNAAGGRTGRSRGGGSAP